MTGDAGTGKSATLKAAVNELWQDGPRMVQLQKQQLTALPALLDRLSDHPLKFIVFIDDLSFGAEEESFSALKAVLEGSVTAKPTNIVLYASSNRRHLIQERFSDRESDDIHRNDTMQELMSLSARFGLHIRFSRPDKRTYLHIVYTLAQQSGLDRTEAELDRLAEQYVLERGGRSARLARQVIVCLLTQQE